MSADPRRVASPSGTGHDTAGRRDSDILAAPISTRDGEPIFPPSVAVPGPACDGSPYCAAPVHIHGCFADYGSCDHPSEHDPLGPASVSPAEPPLVRYRLTVVFGAADDGEAEIAEEKATDKLESFNYPIIDTRLEKLL